MPKPDKFSDHKKIVWGHRLRRYLNFLVGGTVMKLTVQRCVYSIGARKSTRKLTKLTETAALRRRVTISQ